MDALYSSSVTRTCLPSRPTVHHEAPPSFASAPRSCSSTSIGASKPASSTHSASYRPARPSSLSSRQSSSESIKTDTTEASSVVVRASASPPLEDLLQVVYTSSALTRHLSREEISDILQRSRRNNAKRGITGLLLYRDGSFVQFLEGPAHEVDGLYRRIEGDPRHRGIVRILRQKAEKRDFSNWEMAYRDLDLSRMRGSHIQERSASTPTSLTSESSTESEDEELDSMRKGFSEVLNVGLKLGDKTDSDFRAEHYGSSKSRMDLPKDMSVHMRKLVTTFYKLMDRPL